MKLERLRRLRELRLAAEQRREAERPSWPSPLAMAEAMDPATIRTPALDLIDRALVDVAEGREARLVTSVSPQEGKSELASRRWPLWLLVRDPELRVAIVSYSDEMARRWGADIKRDLEDHPELGLSLRADSKAAGRWQIEGHRGGVYCVGIAGSLTGKPVDVLCVDDPIKDLEQAQSPIYRERAWRFWQAVAVPRLGPGSKCVVIQCMAGDTPVLMGDGTEKPLRDVRPGDTAATYEDGALTTSKVRNWANQGPDSIYAIRMKSGRVVRANARHPFLAIEDGEHVWRRTDQLTRGSIIQTATGVSGEASVVQRTDATSPLGARACVCRTTTSGAGLTGTGHHRSTPSAAERRASSTDTASTPTGTLPSSPSSKGCALSAASPLPSGTPAPTGMGSSASTTTTSPARSEGCSATTATLLSATASPPMSFAPPLSTWRPEPDEVVEVVPCGTEDVYDLQINRTENFIANGLVSHNTRWHEDDFAGRLLQSEGDRARGGRWRVINIPAVSEGAGDPLGRPEGVPMQSARGDRDWAAIRASVGEYVWSALYQGRPAPAEGGMFKRLWWRYWRPAQSFGSGERLDLGGRSLMLADMWRFGTADLAASTRTSADWTVVSAWALTLDGDLLLLDRQRARVDERQHFSLVRPLAERWQLDTTFVERSQYGTTLARDAARDGIHLTPVDAELDKFTRALPYSARVSGGRVWLPAGATWLDVWVGEHASFPNGSHDDQVDTGSIATRVAVTKPMPTAAPQPRASSEIDFMSVPL